jgi:hypothetical protein
MIEDDAPSGYVIVPSGAILLQVPAKNQWGFVLCDDEQSWPGGLPFCSWGFLEPCDPRITPDVRERLGPVLEALQEAQ